MLTGLRLYRVPVKIDGTNNATVEEVLSYFYPEGTSRAYSALVGGRNSEQIYNLRKEVAELRAQLVENVKNSQYTNELLEKLVNNSAITSRQLAAISKLSSKSLAVAREEQDRNEADRWLR